MKFKSISLEDKNLFTNLLASRYQENINYNFTSLFIWQEWEPYEWTDCHGTICIKRKNPESMAISPPIAANDEDIIAATIGMQRYFKEMGYPFIIVEVTQNYLDLYNKAFPGKFKVEECRDAANYIYKTTDLAFLKGRRYSSKRNHIHRFFRENPNSRLVPLTRDLIPSCLEVMDTWYNSKSKPNLDMQKEKEGIYKALDHLEDLDYTGACLMTDNKIVAFTFGEPINKDTVGIHVEKADYNYRGAFAVINSLFLKEYWLAYPYVNRDEDMGDEGMRTAKQSYHPCKLHMKYTLRLKEDL